MAMVQDAQSTLTAKYQTTIPAPVRKILGLQKGDKLRFELRDSGEVVLSRDASNEEDPVLAAFLVLLERDMMKRPEAIQPLTPALMNRVRDLVDGVEVDLDAALPDDDV